LCTAEKNKNDAAAYSILVPPVENNNILKVLPLMGTDSDPGSKPLNNYIYYISRNRII
jgi:hypothetical protein